MVIILKYLSQQSSLTKHEASESFERRSGLSSRWTNSRDFSWIIPTNWHGPRRGMKYHPVWITSAETFVRCYRCSLIPPNYKLCRSSAGRDISLFVFFFSFSLSLKKAMLLALRSVTVTRKEGTRLNGERGPGAGELFKYFQSPSEGWQIGRNLGEVSTSPPPSPSRFFSFTPINLSRPLVRISSTIDPLFLSPPTDLPLLIKVRRDESYS